MMNIEYKGTSRLLKMTRTNIQQYAVKVWMAYTALRFPITDDFMCCYFIIFTGKVLR